MRKIVAAVAAAGLWAAVAPPASATARYGPGDYRPGPVHGDSNTVSQADPDSGEVTILQLNIRQPALVHCVGDGPRATLEVTRPAERDLSSVTVSYDEAFMSEHPVIDVAVIGSKSGYLGHGSHLGPKTGEAGSVHVPLFDNPQPGEDVTVQFGLQVHAGCLQHPTHLGLPGSRYVEGGNVVFSSVEFGEE